jgi:hypothetical protein
MRFVCDILACALRSAFAPASFPLAVLFHGGPGGNFLGSFSIKAGKPHRTSHLVPALRPGRTVSRVSFNCHSSPIVFVELPPPRAVAFFGGKS